MTRVLHASAALFLVLALGACESAGQYPSLARREAERVAASAQPAPGALPVLPPLPPASADLVTRLDALGARARAADAEFTRALPAAERAVGAAGAKGSDSRVSAEVALATLQSARGTTATTLAELDSLYATEREVVPQAESPAAQAIATARAGVAALLAGEDDALARLEARLSS